MADTRRSADELLGALIGLARATEGNEFLLTPETDHLIAHSLDLAANGSPAEHEACLARIAFEKQRLVPDCFRCGAPCGRTEDYDVSLLRTIQTASTQKRLQLLHALCALAARVRQQHPTEAPNPPLGRFFRYALYAAGMDSWTEEDLAPVFAELAETEKELEGFKKASC